MTTYSHTERLFVAELQFRLASAVRLATTFNEQPLDLPVQWSHGRHVVDYADVALRKDQADFAACHLQRSASYLMAVGVRDALAATFPDPKNHADPDIRAAYQISRLIRNAFAHSPFDPVWSIDADCVGQTLRVRDIIVIDTTELNGTGFDWRHYGGPLALLRLCQFVRFEILHDSAKRPAERELPPLRRVIHQQGTLVLRQVDEIPADAEQIRRADWAEPVPLAAGSAVVDRGGNGQADD
jgi:hypothetical protein